jgi:hypothetical protein
MKNSLKMIVPIVLLASVQFSCVKGCIDSNALNYEPEATANRGCIYPETFNLTSIGVKAHPSQDAQGNEWDADGAADKFIKVFDDESNTLLYTTIVEDFTPVVYTVNPILSIDSEKTTLRFELYDQDEAEDVLMDSVSLNLKDLTGTSATNNNDFYPVTGTLQGENASIFTLTMTWSE